MAFIETTDFGDLRVATVPVTPFQQNCLLLWSRRTGEGAVVDPGGDVPRILAAIAAAGMKPAKIVLTHGHLDHAGGAAELRESLSGRSPVPVPVIGPDARDQFLLDDLHAQGLRYGVPDMRDVVPDAYLHDGDTVGIAGATMLCRHAPGHTPGHVILVDAASRLALVGDVVFRLSVGRTDFPYGDTAELMRSIERHILTLDDDMAFLCGHGPGSTVGAERAENPFLSGPR